MRGDPNAEAISYKQVSSSASEPLLLSLVNPNSPCGQRIISREAGEKRRSRFAARKAWSGNTRRTEYNAPVQRSASIDALGNRTTYAYDQFGNLASVTDPLGHATVYEYDLRGRKTYEGGATYPVRYTYDILGNKTTMMTYRN